MGGGFGRPMSGGMSPWQGGYYGGHSPSPWMGYGGGYGGGYGQQHMLGGLIGGLFDQLHEQDPTNPFTSKMPRYQGQDPAEGNQPMPGNEQTPPVAGLEPDISDLPGGGSEWQPPWMRGNQGTGKGGKGAGK